jgi:hypothetical protein
MIAPMSRFELRGYLDATSPGQIERDATGRRFAKVPFEELQEVRRAAECHLMTLPNSEMVEVWHVEHCARTGTPFVAVVKDSVIAEGRALSFREEGYVCVRITGPHSHEVPST